MQLLSLFGNVYMYGLMHSVEYSLECLVDEVPPTE